MEIVVCSFWVQRNKISVSPHFSFLCSFTSETFLKAEFSQSEGYFAILSSAPSLFKSEINGLPNCLKSLGACVAKHAARIAIEALRRLY